MLSQLVSVLRRSLNSEAKGSDLLTSKEIEIVKKDAHGSTKCSEDVEDNYLVDFQNVLPNPVLSSPDNENVREHTRDSVRLSDSSSSHGNSQTESEESEISQEMSTQEATAYDVRLSDSFSSCGCSQTGSEKSEIFHETSMQEATADVVRLSDTSSYRGNNQTRSEKSEILQKMSTQEATGLKGTQSCFMKSVAVQCEPTLKVTQGVQYEPVLLMSQSVQCELVEQVSQGTQYEPVLKVTRGVQYEPLSIVQGSTENQSESTNSQVSKNKSIYVSKGVNCESISSSEKHEWGSTDQYFESDLSITLPPLQEEVDIVTSSQRTVCMSSSSSCSSSQSNQITVVSELCDKSSAHCSFIEDQVDSCSKSVLSDIDVASKKKKGISQVVIRKNTKKCVSPKEKSDISTPVGGNEKSVEHFGEESCEMETNKECSVREDMNTKTCVKRRSRKIKERQQVDAQKVFESSPAQHETASTSSGKHDEKSDGEYSAEELLLEMGTNENYSENDAKPKTCGELRSTGTKRKQIATEKMLQSATASHETARDVAPPSQIDGTDGLQWFSSLACERCSSPESIGEDTFEELRESNSYCYRNLLTKVQLKDTSVLADNSISFCDVERSTPKKSAAEKSCDRIMIDSSGEQTLEKRQKASCDAKDTSVRNASSGVRGQLVSYSDSSNSSISSCDNASESDQNVPRKMQEQSKKEDHKSVGKSREVQKTIVCVPKQQHEKSPVRKDSISARRTSARVIRSTSGSVKRRRIEVNKSTSGSDTDSDSESRSRRVSKTLNRSADKSIGMKKNITQATEQQKGESPAKSGSVSVTRTVVGNSKSNTGCGSVKNKAANYDIWDSDDDDSVVSTATYHTSMSGHSSRPRAPYTKQEREAIVWYIIDHKYYKLIKGIALWQRMEKDKVCDRTWQSMKEHFIKKILPQIETFHLDPSVTKRFVCVRGK